LVLAGHSPGSAGLSWIRERNESVDEHDGRIVAYSDRTITTSPTGFVGHGTDTEVLNGQVEMFRLTDILTNPAGERIRARHLIVLDLSTGAVRVVGGELTCLGPA
jgi:hypothetical protein